MAEWIVLMIMAFALGMDAFSMSLAIGLNARVRLKDRVAMSSVVGSFHILMPVIGMIGGQWIATYFEHVALWIAGGLLIIIGAQMIWESTQSRSEALSVPSGAGLLLFSLLVSIDSFSIGITLGIVDAKMVAVLMLFGMASAMCTWVGLWMGSRFHGMLGKYGEVLGGLILLAFGLKLLWPITG